MLEFKYNGTPIFIIVCDAAYDSGPHIESVETDKNLALKKAMEYKCRGYCVQIFEKCVSPYDGKILSEKEAVFL